MTGVDGQSYHRLTHIPGDKNPADFLTKPVPALRFWRLAFLSGMMPVDINIFRRLRRGKSEREGRKRVKAQEKEKRIRKAKLKQSPLLPR